MDVTKIALAKSPFQHVSSAELANQVAAKKKAEKKLPVFYNTIGIYYPPLLSMEQCSSEPTASYKSRLALKGALIDLTGGFGVDSYYFSKAAHDVTHCEINEELSQIAAHNASVLDIKNISFISGDGLEYLRQYSHFATIYIDPARRSKAGKVFRLADCTPNVVEHYNLLTSKADRIIIKTSPLLDISAGLKELPNVTEIHILSVKNECKEVLWVIDTNQQDQTTVKPIQFFSITLNEDEKVFSFFRGQEASSPVIAGTIGEYLYEPDAALLKSGAFDLIGNQYHLQKLHPQTQLFCADTWNKDFPGKVFKIKEITPFKELKKQTDLKGNVIVRNFQETPEALIKKYKIRSDKTGFLIFTQSTAMGYMVIKAEVVQYY